MDILDRLISLAQISGEVNVKCEFSGKWAVLHSEQVGQGIVHIVTYGNGYVKLPNQAAQPVKQGDILFFPRASEHILRYNGDGTNYEYDMTIYKKGAFEFRKIGKQAAEFELFCANVYYDQQAELIKCLPDMIFIKLEPKRFNLFVDLFNAEYESKLIGSNTIVNGLSNILLTLILRSYLVGADNQLLGLLKGWQDKRLKGVLNAIIEEPEKPWLIQDMVAVAYLSRSQLIRLFKQYLEVSPHVFLHRIRLNKAAMLLKQHSDSILKIALSTGFQSDTHFGKAFKKYYGVTPSQYRHNSEKNKI